MFYLYILYSDSAKRHYIGQSENPQERLIQHNSRDKDKYTGKYSDWKMLALFECGETRSDAVVLESFIKKQKSKKLLLKLIDPEFIPKEKLSQLVRVPHVRD